MGPHRECCIMILHAPFRLVNKYFCHLVLMTYFFPLFQNVEGEDHLNHIDWRKNINKSQDPKHWISYVDKLLHLLLDYLSTRDILYVSVLDTMAEQGNNSYMKFQDEKYEYLEGQMKNTKRKSVLPDLLIDYAITYVINGSRTETLPTVLIQLSTAEPFSLLHGMLDAEPMYGSHTIYFSLEKKLRLNVTFLSIDFLVVGKICQYDKIWIQSQSKLSTSNFVFCGIHSQFSLYPGSTDVKLVIKVYKARHPINIRVMFSVISNRIMESHSLLKSKTRSVLLTSTAVHNIIIQNTMVYSFKFQAEKYNGINFSLTVNNKMYILLFSGPGYKSRKINISETVMYFVNTFQCSLQLIKHTKVFSDNFATMILYKVKLLPRTLKYVTDNENRTIHLPITRGSIESNCSVFVFHTEKNDSLHLRINSFTQKGSSHPYCLYGRMIIYKLDHKDPKMFESLCKKYEISESNDIFNQRSFYSYESALMVVFYQYKQYSVITIKFTLSTSDCKGIKINFCKILNDKNQLIKSNNLLSLMNELGNLQLLLFTNSCFVLQFHTNPHTTLNISNEDCKISLSVGKNQPGDQLWKFQLFGYIERRDIYKGLQVYGEDFNKTIKVKYVENNFFFVDGCHKFVDVFVGNNTMLCNYMFENGILVNVTYYVKTPTHENTVTPTITVSRWSQSWTNIIIHWAGTIAESIMKFDLKEDPLLVRNFPTSIIRRVEVVLLISVKTERKLNLTIEAFMVDGRWRWLECEQKYKIKKQRRTTVVLALPGYPLSIYLFGTKNASALIDYIWIYDDVKVQPFITRDICGAKTYKGQSFHPFVITKEFHSTINIGAKKYLFIKNITLPCLIEGFSGLGAKCNASKYSWNDAMQVCHQMGANLPQFLSTKEQDELLHILKVIKLFYYVEAVFIGYNAAGRNRYEFFFVDWQPNF